MHPLPSHPSWAPALCLPRPRPPSRLPGCGGKSGAGRLAPGRTGRARPQAPRTVWAGRTGRTGRVPAASLPPSPQASAPVSEEPDSCAKPGTGYFWRCGGNSECLAAAQKYMVCEPGRQEPQAQGLAAGLLPPLGRARPLRGPVAPLPAWGGHCSRSAVPRPPGPGQNRSSMKAKSSQPCGGRSQRGRRTGPWGRRAGGPVPSGLSTCMWAPVCARPTGSGPQGRLNGAFPMPLAFTRWTAVRPGSAPGHRTAGAHLVWVPERTCQHRPRWGGGWQRARPELRVAKGGLSSWALRGTRLAGPAPAGTRALRLCVHKGWGGTRGPGLGLGVAVCRPGPACRERGSGSERAGPAPLPAAAVAWPARPRPGEA